MKIKYVLFLVPALTVNMVFADCVKTLTKDPNVSGGTIVTIVCDKKDIDAQIAAYKNALAQAMQAKSESDAKFDEDIAFLQKELDNLVNAQK